MGATLFEFSAMVDEKRDLAGNLVEKEQLVFQQKVDHLTAKDQIQATAKVWALIPPEIIDDPDKADRLVVMVRPF